MPDVTQIPLLANIFSVSTDKIFGIDVSINEKKIEEINDRVNDIGNNGDITDAIHILREGLAEFPNSYELMSTLAHFLLFTNYPNPAPENYSEMKHLYEEILDGSKDDILKNSAIVNLCWLYREARRIDEAKTLAESIPHLIYSREDCLLSLL